MENKMNEKKAIKLAIEALKTVRQKLAFEANIAKIDNNAPPYSKKALKKYDEYSDAIRYFTEKAE